MDRKSIMGAPALLIAALWGQAFAYRGSESLEFLIGRPKEIWFLCLGAPIGDP